ncbi:MAG: hypothetical protein Q9165_001851 [Trypethelium subeluteriae]
MAYKLAQDFFGAYNDFAIHDNETFVEGFLRLAAQRKWKVGGRTYRRHWLACFGVPYQPVEYDGTDDLSTWQQLCEDTSIHPVPDSITKCKKALGRRTLFINLRDMMKYRRAREVYELHEAAEILSADEQRPPPPRRFNNIEELRKYTRKKGKSFPKEVAKEDGFLKLLLRQIV